MTAIGAQLGLSPCGSYSCPPLLPHTKEQVAGGGGGAPLVKVSGGVRPSSVVPAGSAYRPVLTVAGVTVGAFAASTAALNSCPAVQTYAGIGPRWSPRSGTYWVIASWNALVAGVESSKNGNTLSASRKSFMTGLDTTAWEPVTPPRIIFGAISCCGHVFTRLIRVDEATPSTRLCAPDEPMAWQVEV